MTWEFNFKTIINLNNKLHMEEDKDDKPSATVTGWVGGELNYARDKTASHLAAGSMMLL